MSKQHTHTPGPWKAQNDPPSAKGGAMALVFIPGGKRSADFTGSGASYAEDCANATLAAEAPAMYAALREIADDDATGHLAHREMARAILARIEGRQT